MTLPVLEDIKPYPVHAASYMNSQSVYWYTEASFWYEIYQQKLSCFLLGLAFPELPKLHKKSKRISEWYGGNDISGKAQII